jgi:hypothetical protein
VKLIQVDWGGLIATYPAHQLLYFKYIPSAKVTHLRFVQDPQIYTFEGDNVYVSLEDWITNPKGPQTFLITRLPR